MTLIRCLLVATLALTALVFVSTGPPPDMADHDTVVAPDIPHVAVTVDIDAEPHPFPTGVLDPGLDVAEPTVMVAGILRAPWRRDHVDNLRCDRGLGGLHTMINGMGRGAARFTGDASTTRG